jgi:large subunit ribosomal protein L31
MKTDIHPHYHSDAAIKCANCGTQFDMGSTNAEITVEICSKCHPFYTGKKILIDTEGRVDKFQQKRAGADASRIKKDRRKKTLEERVNEELAVQLQKEKAKTAKKEVKASRFNS